MKCLNVVVKGDLIRPFQINRKEIAPAVGAAMVGAGASLLGNLLGSSSQSSSNMSNYRIAKMNADLQRETNEQNLQLQREVNEQNYKMFQEQNAFNFDMWNKNNEYNDPKQVAERLRAAGINPATAFGSPTPASQISSTGGSPSVAPDLKAPYMDYAQHPFFPDFSGVAQGANAFFQNELLSKEIEGKSVDNAIQRVELMFRTQEKISNLFEQKARVTKILSESKLSDSQREYYVSLKKQVDRNIDLFNDQYEDLKVREKKQNDVLDSQNADLLSSVQLKRAQSYFTSIQAKYFPKMSEAQISLLGNQALTEIQRAEVLVREGVLKSKQAVSQHLSNELQNLLLVDAKTKRKIRDNDPLLKELYWFSDYTSDLILQFIRKVLRNSLFTL